MGGGGGGGGGRGGGVAACFSVCRHLVYNSGSLKFSSAWQFLDGKEMPAISV